MKPILMGATIVAALAFLAGCPVYSDNGDYRVCDGIRCWDCPDTTVSYACVPWTCSTDSDCVAGYECTADGCLALGSEAGVPAGASCTVPSQCAPGSVCGQDDTCHAGDCTDGWGCSAGYVCLVARGLPQCFLESGLTDASTGTSDDGGLADSSADRSSSGDATGEANVGSADGAVISPGDASGDAEGADVAPLTLPCNSDSQCSATGSRCVDGECIAQAQLCSDATQCSGANESCVDGLCTPTCSASDPCPIGFGCDLIREVCSLNPGACSSDSTCAGGTVCVESHCVPPCAAIPDAGAEGGGSDGAGGICPTNSICVNGGCVPEERASFACKNNGDMGSLANRCPPAAICLHGDCYVACFAGDGGGCAPSQTCTNVAIAQGTFAVCGNGSNLGSECDPAAGADCPTNLVCIDGYCK
jgi:hypothetical protein